MIAPPDETAAEPASAALTRRPLQAMETGDEPPSNKTEQPSERPLTSDTAQGDFTLPKSADDDLPEQIELTPEIVEEDALRNDFMLRLAVVLLACLFACTQIGETRTLVHVKTGQYLGGHGVLPPRTDVFTHSAADQPWVNLSWLFDLVVAGVYAVGGAIGLTIFKSLIAAVTFYLLLKIGKRDVPTWWSSICAGLALIACAGQFTAEPQLITLLGLVLTFWFLIRWQQDGEKHKLWGLVPLFVLWANLDPRAYLGLVVLMLFTAGELLGALVGRSLVNDEAQRSHLWLIVPVSLVAFLINPFGWHSLISPAALYGVEYPAWRQWAAEAGGELLERYLPLTDAAFWTQLTLPTIAALVLAATVPITFALNRRNVTPAHALVFLGVVAIGLANSRDLGAVAVVCAILATLNAQEWYVESFRQTYSVELSERVFSVGGRAITAFALFGLAFLAVTGRLLGEDANRLGFGFRQQLANHVEGLKQDLEQTELSGHGFNFSVPQGDVLIWLDYQPFIDSRLNLFAQGGAESLYETHRQLAEALVPSGPKEGETPAEQQARLQAMRELKEEKLSEYQITHAVASLAPPRPLYGAVVLLLLRDPAWQLVKLGPMAGWFYQFDPQDNASLQHVIKHHVDFLKLAFRTPEEEVLARPALAQPPSWADKVFSLKSGQAQSNSVLLARHYTILQQEALPRYEALDLSNPQHVQVLGASLGTAMAWSHLAIRHAQQALVENPNSTLAYQLLGDNYSRLGTLEELISRTGLRTLSNRTRRYYQAVTAYNQVVTTDPDNPEPHRFLGNFYLNRQRWDLALREFERFFELTEVPPAEDKPAREEYERRQRVKADLEKKLEEIRQPFDEALEKIAKDVPEADQARAKLSLAGPALQNGCVLMALDFLGEGEDPTAPPDPSVGLFRAKLKLEAGLLEEAYQELGQLEGRLEQDAGQLAQTAWREQVAFIALVAGEYDRAVTLWTTQANEFEEATMRTVLGTLPLANRPVEPQPMFGSIRDNWAAANVLATRALTQSMPRQIDGFLFEAALCDLEVGRPEEAAKLLRQVLQINPESQFRPLAVFYLNQTTGEINDVYPPSYYVPTWAGMFADGPAIAEKPSEGAKEQRGNGAK